jgi:hypothetical protein
MEITNDLINKFFEKRCTREETEAVAAYLSGNPELLDTYLPVKEWNEIMPDLSLPVNSRMEMLEYSKAQLFEIEDRAKIIKFTALKWTAIAASVLFLVLGVWYMAGRNSNSSYANIAVSKKNAKGNKQEKSLVWITLPNRTGKSIKLNLPDGSVVRLGNNSSLKYLDSFGVRKRDLWLEGNAFFSVAKNRNSPFTVYSGALATTALGTYFEVSGPGTGIRAIRIKLYTGKVVIKAMTHLPGWNKDIYLLPGEQAFYDQARVLTAISQFGKPSPTAKEEMSAGQDLVFNNRSLKEVMDKLTAQYHAKIIYKDSDLSGMNFTGTVSSSDSLIVFLKLLANMNGLEIQEQRPVYIVTKPRASE